MQVNITTAIQGDPVNPSIGLPIVSLFSGALGLDLGLEQAGFQVRVAVECNKFAAATIRRNRPDTPVIERKIEEVTTEEILEVAGLKPGEPMIVSAGPSCQAFSTAGKRGSLGDPRGTLFRQFLRVVHEARPRFFVMENVRGVFSAAIRHRPLRERGPGYPPLAPDEELGSAFILILRELQAIGYYTVFNLLNTADFGVPQARERVLFIGSRDGEMINMPESTHSKMPMNGKSSWVTLRQAFEGMEDSNHTYTDLPSTTSRYLSLIPEGGNWRDLPSDLQAEALGAAYISWGGRSGFFRRLSWERPAPSITTNPGGKATMMCHPTELRPLSVQECARLQQFPDTWQFDGETSQQYIQIGNAVPVGLGSAIGRVIVETIKQPQYGAPLGKVVCTNNVLLDHMVKRPRTMLNPVRMRKVKDQESLRQWHNGRDHYRTEILDYVTRSVEEQEIEAIQLEGDWVQ